MGIPGKYKCITTYYINHFSWKEPSFDNWPSFSRKTPFKTKLDSSRLALLFCFYVLIYLVLRMYLFIYKLTLFWLGFCRKLGLQFWTWKMMNMESYGELDSVVRIDLLHFLKKLQFTAFSCWCPTSFQRWQEQEYGHGRVLCECAWPYDRK